MDIREALKGVDYTFFEKILSSNDFTKMNGYETARFVYAATWMKYRMKFYEEKARADKAMRKIVDKNIEMENILEKFKELAAVYEKETGCKYEVPQTSVDLSHLEEAVKEKPEGKQIPEAGKDTPS